MTRRPEKARDFEKFPLLQHEIAQLQKAQRQKIRKLIRQNKRDKFNVQARVNNTIHGIKPRV